MSNIECNENEVSFYFGNISYPVNQTELGDLGLEHYIKIAIYGLCIIASLFGNLVVILVVCLNPRMRGTVNIYLVNVAVSDLLISLCCTWVHLINDITVPRWVLGAIMCKFHTAAQSKSNKILLPF